MSPPVRGRGLKLLTYLLNSSIIKSPPIRGRGLKQCVTEMLITEETGITVGGWKGRLNRKRLGGAIMNERKID